MALSTPVVAFEDGGVPEQLGDSGVLCPPGDTKAMARAVIELLEHRERASEAAHRAAARVEELFDIDLYGRRVRECIREILPAQLNAPTSRC
jgi:glycosyltransferase involved in cell wall biosynthesis